MFILFVQVPLYFVHTRAVLAYPCGVIDFIKSQETLFVKLFTTVLQEKEKLAEVEAVYESQSNPWCFLALAAAKLCNESDFLEVAPVRKIVHQNHLWFFLFIHLHYQLQGNASDDDLKKLAKNKGLPVVWMRCGEANDKFSVVVEKSVLRQSTAFDSFFIYITSFSVFDIALDTFFSVSRTFGHKHFGKGCE